MQRTLDGMSLRAKATQVLLAAFNGRCRVLRPGRTAACVRRRTMACPRVRTAGRLLQMVDPAGSGRLGYSCSVMRKVIALFCVALVALQAGLLVTGCAGELPAPGRMSIGTGGEATVDTGGEATTYGSNEATTGTTEQRAVRLGRQVAANWEEGIQTLVPLLEGIPPIDSIEQAVSQLKEEYVQKMIVLGRQIATLEPADQQSVYDRAVDILSTKGETDWFTRYKELYERYAAGSDQRSQDFAVLLSTFNTMTQYAFFDLLATQDPSEAARLGIPSAGSE